ncbi:MAG: N-acetyltransferase [Pseudonocardiales bacterium]|nr:MAG: N-acetyltransferase [Pseudonocardiales bacterium]
MDDWLRRYAGQNQRNNTAATWVIAEQGYRVAAYTTLSMTAIDHTAAPAPLRKAAPDPVPALLVGRLAVDEAFTGLGVGTALVRHLLATAVELNLSAACKAVVVTALHEQARSWWLKLGFTPLEDDGLELYLLTADIHKTLG